VTHAEQILRAIARLQREGPRQFSRSEVRHAVGVSADEWMQSYTPVFQGMRVDQPGGAPPVGARRSGAFRRIFCGRYEFTPRGRQLLHELGECPSLACQCAVRRIGGPSHDRTTAAGVDGAAWSVRQHFGMNNRWRRRPRV